MVKFLTVINFKTTHLKAPYRLLQTNDNMTCFKFKIIINFYKVLTSIYIRFNN